MQQIALSLKNKTQETRIADSPYDFSSKKSTCLHKIKHSGENCKDVDHVVKGCRSHKNDKSMDGEFWYFVANLEISLATFQDFECVYRFKKSQAHLCDAWEMEFCSPKRCTPK